MRSTFFRLAQLVIFIITGFLLFNSYFSTLIEGPTPLLLISIFIILLCTYLLIQNAVYNYQYYRLSKYPQTYDALTMAFSQVHYANKELEKYVGKELDSENILLIEEKVIEVLTHACNRLVQVFSIITGFSCSVSIKLLVLVDHNPRENEVFTLVRDNVSIGRNTPESDRWQDVRHYVLENTDFNEIIKNENKGKMESFICNYLPFKSNYHNSSFEIYGYPPLITNNGILKLLSKLRRWINWTLPYKSTIVVPIKPKRFEPNRNNALGFVCIDSYKMGIFKKYYDISLINGFGDGIYNLLEKFHKIKN